MQAIILCPGQGSQSVGMGVAWAAASEEARETLARADAVLGPLQQAGGRTLSEVCKGGPAETINRTDVSQPALYAVGVACMRALAARMGVEPIAAAGLSLGEYTALHIAGCFSFEEGLRLVAARGRLMQAAAEASEGSMVALVGADEAAAEAVCQEAAQGEVLVAANFNAPGQIVLSGSKAACQRAAAAASARGLRAAPLAVAGAFHSPLMAPAAEGMARELAAANLQPLRMDVWSNVTAAPHHRTDMSLLRQALVRQIASPVRWSHSCEDMLRALRAGRESLPPCLELAPGTVLKGLMRRIDRTCEVTSHDEPKTAPAS